MARRMWPPPDDRAGGARVWGGVYTPFHYSPNRPANRRLKDGFARLRARFKAIRQALFPENLRRCDRVGGAYYAADRLLQLRERNRLD